MVRRIASQVHKETSRLMRAGFIKQEPLWYKAVLDHPPFPLPPMASCLDKQSYLQRQSIHPFARLRSPKNVPLPIRYLKDEVRRQFFRDHPLESFRPTSLVESREAEKEHLVRGNKWTRLSQRRKNPTPEDAVSLVVNLYKHNKTSLSNAYTRAIAQFRSLRSEHEVTSAFAVMEAQAYGAIMGLSESQRAFEDEKNHLETSHRKAELNRSIMVARKRWQAVLCIASCMGKFESWDKGQAYIGLWSRGICPTYVPALTEPESIAGLLLPSSLGSTNHDFMGLTQKSLCLE